MTLVKMGYGRPSRTKVVAFTTLLRCMSLLLALLGLAGRVAASPLSDCVAKLKNEMTAKISRRARRNENSAI
jgi:hypothetical protein